MFKLIKFSSTIGMGKKERTEFGTEVRKEVKRNPTLIWPYLCGTLFVAPSPTLPPILVRDHNVY